MNGQGLLDDLDDPVVCRAIVLSLRIYMNNIDSVTNYTVPRIHMTEIASGKSPETVALIELGRMR